RARRGFRSWHDDIDGLSGSTIGSDGHEVLDSFDAAVGEEQITLVAVQASGPIQKLVGAKLHQRVAAGIVIGDVAIAGQDGSWPNIVCLDANKVADVFVLQGGEAVRRRAVVGGTNEHARRRQFSSKRLKMAESKV